MSLLFAGSNSFYTWDSKKGNIYYELRIVDTDCAGSYLGCYDMSLLFAGSDSFYTWDSKEENIYYEFRVSPLGG